MPRTSSFLMALILSVSAIAATAAEPVVQAKPALPATPEAWLETMLNAKKNGVAFKDPAAFAEWLDAITEPRFMTALAAAAIDPGTYPKVLSDAIDPAAARNWTEFTDPQLYLRWMLAGSNPSYQQAIVNKMTDPAKMKRWVEALSRPDGLVPKFKVTQQMSPATSGAAYAPSQDWLKLPAGKTPEANARFRY